MDQTRRLFIALPFDRSVRESLSDTARLIGSFTGRVKAVSPDIYHITVKFLGQTDAGLAERIIREFNSLRVDTGKIPCAIKGLGAFPSLGRASVLWAGVSAPESLVSLFRQIEDFAASLGFAREKREFRPHLTLGRIRGDGGLPGPLKEHFAANKDREFCASSFTRLVLFESDLQPKGPVYTEIAAREL